MSTLYKYIYIQYYTCIIYIEIYIQGRIQYNCNIESLQCGVVYQKYQTVHFSKSQCAKAHVTVFSTEMFVTNDTAISFKFDVKSDIEFDVTVRELQMSFPSTYPPNDPNGHNSETEPDESVLHEIFERRRKNSLLQNDQIPAAFALS